MITRLLIGALLLGVLLLAPAAVRAQTQPDPNGYVTGSPVTDWLGLATSAGRDAIQLGDGCTGVVPGVNVVQDEAGDLQIVDPIRGIQPDRCVIINRLHMSDVPCARNAAGACDVTFS